MPSTLDPGDRKILLIAGSFLFLLVITTLAFAPSPNAAGGQGVPSTYSTATNGAQAAYLLLRDMGYRSERWEKPPTELPTNPEGQILILAGPTSFPEKAEREALQQFVRSGGWIVYAGNFPFLFLETGTVTSPSIPIANPKVESFRALAPSVFTRGVPEISMFANNRWVDSDAKQIPLFGEKDAPVVVTWMLDKGRILWLAAPTPFTNSGITRTGNLEFILNCIQAVRPGAPAGKTTILWDEYFHGYRGSLWDYFEETPVPWAILQVGLIVVFVLITFARRSGPIYAPIVVSRLSPLEFADTLGDLYRRANAGPAAVRVAYDRFRSILVRRLSLASSVSNAQLDAAVRERLGWRQPGFFDTLQRADQAAHATDLAGADALKIVQALDHYEILFGFKARTTQEKS